MEPWQIIQIAYIDKLPRTVRGNQYLFVIIDSSSGWVEAFPIKIHTPKATAKKLWMEDIYRFATRGIIDSDWGLHFTRLVFKQLLQTLGKKQHLHIPYQPQTSGQVEKMNCTIKESL